jgi:undecaprenyl pyrophosphate phosphatase UppP
MKFKDQDEKGKNWMSAMGAMFLIMAAIIALRNLYLVSTELSFDFYLDNFVNSQITNEKFVIVMIIIGGVLIYCGRYKEKEDYGQPDEHELRRYK